MGFFFYYFCLPSNYSLNVFYLLCATSVSCLHLFLFLTIKHWLVWKGSVTDEWTAPKLLRNFNLMKIFFKKANKQGEMIACGCISQRHDHNGHCASWINISCQIRKSMRTISVFPFYFYDASLNKTACSSGLQRGFLVFFLVGLDLRSKKLYCLSHGDR